MAKHSQSDPKQENRRLQEALRQCRELVEETEELIERARRVGRSKRS